VSREGGRVCPDNVYEMRMTLVRSQLSTRISETGKASKLDKYFPPDCLPLPGIRTARVKIIPITWSRPASVVTIDIKVI
jgi:hypothetical protein